MSEKVPLRRCKRVIALVWLIGAGLLFVVLVTQSLNGHFGSSQGQVWSWYLSAVSPSLGLIIAVLAAEALQDAGEVHEVDGFFYRIALGVSALYLLSLWAVVLMEPLRPDLTQGLPELSSQANQWLGGIQGLVTAALGVFFVKTKEAPTRRRTPTKRPVDQGNQP